MYGKLNPHSEESKQKIANTLKELYKTKNGYWLGKHHSELTKQKMSRQRLGRKLKRRKENYVPWNLDKHLSKEHKEKISQANKGRHLSIKHKIRISQANKGKKLNPEHIEVLKQRVGENNPFYGKHHTEETIQKLRQINLGKLWVTKDDIHKFIPSEELEDYLLQGFHKGRK